MLWRSSENKNEFFCRYFFFRHTGVFFSAQCPKKTVFLCNTSSSMRCRDLIPTKITLTGGPNVVLNFHRDSCNTPFRKNLNTEKYFFRNTNDIYLHIITRVFKINFENGYHLRVFLKHINIHIFTRTEYLSQHQTQKIIITFFCRRELSCFQHRSVLS